MTAKLKLVVLLTSILMAATQATAAYQECTSTITSNFNAHGHQPGRLHLVHGCYQPQRPGIQPDDTLRQPRLDNIYRQQSDLYR
jgi:hypothetical protein